MLMFCTTLQAQQQLTYRNFNQTLAALDSAIQLNQYSKAFIVHFNFCSSTKYCGENLINFMLRTKGDRILVVCENTDAKILAPLKTQSRFEFKAISNHTLTQYGLFSVYNILLNPRKKKIIKLQ
ncbi:MAG TPA: hypothetical protein PK239_18735 [Chitinophagales bacterium]|nr:hypothetical protein [Chitinophagales bacterium]